MPHYATHLADARTITPCPPDTAPSTSLLGARVIYYQTGRNADGLPRIVTTGTITGLRTYARTLWVNIEPDQPRYFARWHILQDAVISYIWGGAS
jgi:hypothetical protein